MNYVWELILEADAEGIQRDKIRFREARIPSPYLEISFENLNTSSIDDRSVEINPLYRFAEVFSRICDRNISQMPGLRECFLDICIHYFAQLDLREGISRQDFYIYFLSVEFGKSFFGKKAADSMKLFNKQEICKWLIPFMQLYRTQNYRYEFTRAVCGVYSNAYVYESNDSAYEFLLYLGVKESDIERKRIQFLIDAFLPVQFCVYIFYENHFGIIGIDETMVIDEMAIF